MTAMIILLGNRGETVWRDQMKKWWNTLANGITM
jgi:hypothetical protein